MLTAKRLQDVHSFEPDDTPAFHELLVAMLDDLDMPPLDLCEEFDVSLGIVARWIDGRTAPAPPMRVAILHRLASLITTPDVAVAC